MCEQERQGKNLNLHHYQVFFIRYLCHRTLHARKSQYSLECVYIMAQQNKAMQSFYFCIQLP